MTVSVGLLGGAQLQATAAAIVTASVGTAVRLDKATFTNLSADAVTITAYIVAPGQSAGASNTIISAYSIAAGACYVSPELAGHVLPPGYSLQALASTANQITALVSGTLVS